MKLGTYMGLDDVTGVRCGRTPLVDTAPEGKGKNTVEEEGDLDTVLIATKTVVPNIAGQKRKAAAPAASKKKKNAKEIKDTDLSTFVPADSETAPIIVPDEQDTLQPPGGEETNEETDSEPLVRTRSRTSISAEDGGPSVTALEAMPNRNVYADIRVDNLDAILNVSKAAATEQYAYLQSCPPAVLRRRLESMSPAEEHQLDTQLTLLNIVKDCNRLRRHAEMESEVRKASRLAEKETAAAEELRGKVSKLEEELRAAKDAMMKAEAALSSVTIERDCALSRERSLEETVDDISEKLEKSEADLKEAAETIKDHCAEKEQLKKDRDSFELEFATLQSGLPKIVSNALGSETINALFGEAMLAMRDLERVKFWNLITEHIQVPSPLPTEIADKLSDDCVDRASRASAALETITIPSLVALSLNEKLTAQEIVDAEL